jgi:glycosyltransferase involved in cell wall biosynthesis
MSHLVYLSPVPWVSFAQRPHKFVAWFHDRTGGKVLWVDPYPTRLPNLSDFRRLKAPPKAKSIGENDTHPAWLSVIRPRALPIEPLPGSGLANAPFWQPILRAVNGVAKDGPGLLVSGKPSVLGLTLRHRLQGWRSVYDAMDDFPAFYTGFSKAAMRWREQQLVRGVDAVLASSTALQQRWLTIRNDVQLVPNGLDAALLPDFHEPAGAREQKILGYVGTIASWFDWDWVLALAGARPQDVVRLIGPVFTPTPADLPRNIEMLPACDHQSALTAMQRFDVGLIPFRQNQLTASVDPIKYYEYRALGLPVVSTNFGEMALRGSQDGTWISQQPQDASALVAQALQHRATTESVQQFRTTNSWNARFDAASQAIIG